MQLKLRRLLKWLCYIALGGYVLLALSFLGMRYWLLPNIEQWREPLQRELSEHLPVELELGNIQAWWQGSNPGVTLRDVVLSDDDGHTLLKIPSLRAVVAWRSLFSGSPRFLDLQADGVSLNLRRDAQDRISIVGYEVDVSEASHGEQESQGSSAFLHWLSQQESVRFSRASISWLDEHRGAPPLALRDVSLQLRRKPGGHFFSVLATPPSSLGDAFKLQADVRLALTPGNDLSLDDLSGIFHIDVEAMRPRGWQPWLDVYTALESGRVSWKAWQQVERGMLGRHVSQVLVERGGWSPKPQTSVRAETARLYLAGQWDALHGLFASVAQQDAAVMQVSADAVRLVAQLQGLEVEVATLLDAPLRFDQVALTAGLADGAQTGLQVNVDTAQVRNADMDVSFHGLWHERGGGSAGIADFEGVFTRAELAAIVRYLPLVVNDEARDWMRRGLLAGRLLDASVRLQGDLVHFPFGEQPEQGDFEVGGRVQSAVIDYAPVEVVGAPGWPKLEALNGFAQLHRASLTIRADSMQMRPDKEVIELRDVEASIPDIERDSVLSVKGSSRAPAAAYIALLQKSPLATLLDGMFDAAQGAGIWEVPIALTIPLTHSADTRVQGEVVFNKGKLQWSPEVPVLSDLSGRLVFNEETVSAKELQGVALGGPVKISGGVGKGHKGLSFEGYLHAKALSEYLKGGLTGLLEGSTSYRLVFSREAGDGIGLQFSSSLEGMAVNLPAPLNKPAASRWPLQATWRPVQNRSKHRESMLVVSLGERLEAQFLHADGDKHANGFFKAGVIQLGGKADMPADGLAIDIRTQEFDVDAWRNLGSRGKGGGQATERATTILPQLRDIRVQAEKARVLGMDLDKLTFTARQPEGSRWRVDVSSTETAGTLFWQARRGRIEGDVEAHFQRLSVGNRGADSSGADDEEADFKLDDEVDFPAIRLKVDNLKLYGREVGALSVVGLNDVRAHRWKLEQLELGSTHAKLEGSGVWQLDGPQRGLRLQAKASFDDLGAYLTKAGFEDLLEGGQGQAEGVIEWRDVPWRFDRARLNGSVNIELAKGRFINVGSNSARLLELLSLQSVKRLAKLNWNPGGLLKQGFPFDSLKGDIRLHDGIMHSENYRITGPVATIVIAGDVSLPAETLDIYAVVVPTLDVSGAAIAAGIAVNPIVGVGAFLTQWLLKEPMSRAMTAEYRVRGSFDSPEIREITSEREGEKGTLPGHPVSETGRNQ
ncbi:MAG TPA: YhdP family protein [Burkholderiaceae bacterium]|nr:YhdP family protein [Burkholderiaceae bacterium]